MLMSYENPDDYVSEFTQHACQFHQIAPGESFAGCTCSATYARRKATPEERESNIKAREAREARKGEAYRSLGLPGSAA